MHFIIVLVVHLPNYMLDYIFRCLYDYVEIIVTDYQNHQHVSARYCGDRTPPNLETMQHTVDVRFHSENSHHYSGFKATYSFLDERKSEEEIIYFNYSNYGVLLLFVY